MRSDLVVARDCLFTLGIILCQAAFDFPGRGGHRCRGRPMPLMSNTRDAATRDRHHLVCSAVLPGVDDGCQGGRYGTTRSTILHMAESLEQRFDEAMHELYSRIVHECGRKYHPTIFHDMLESQGGLETAHRLLRSDADFFSYGFERLCE